MPSKSEIAVEQICYPVSNVPDVSESPEPPGQRRNRLICLFCLGFGLMSFVAYITVNQLQRAENSK